MTDTPDALMARYAVACKTEANARASAWASAHEKRDAIGQEIVAALTAGDAAIKRVAELETRLNERSVDIQKRGWDIAEKHAHFGKELFECADALYLAVPSENKLASHYAHRMSSAFGSYKRAMTGEIEGALDQARLNRKWREETQADLAAARAEIEQLTKALREIAGREGPFSMPWPDAQETYAGFAVVRARRALAPKETNNG